jgi:RAD51-like protein 2
LIYLLVSSQNDTVVQTDPIHKSASAHSRSSSSSFQQLSEAQISHEEALLVLKVALPESNKASSANAQTAKQLLEIECTSKRIITFCPELDTILGGGIPTGQITEFCGVPGIGKTQLGMQLSIDVQLPAEFGGLEGQAIYIDTEGSFMVERCAQMADAFISHLQRIVRHKNDPVKLAAASKVTKDTVLENIHYYRVRDGTEQVAVLETLPLMLESHPTIKVIIIDSIAFHLRSEYTDMSARTRSLAEMAQKLMALATAKEVAVILMNQVTTKVIKVHTTTTTTTTNNNNNNAVVTRLVPALGDSWAHAATNRIVLYWKDGTRQAFVYKSPTRPAATAEYTVTQDGVRSRRMAKRPRGEGD